MRLYFVLQLLAVVLLAGSVGAQTGCGVVEVRVYTGVPNQKIEFTDETNLMAFAETDSKGWATIHVPLVQSTTIAHITALPKRDTSRWYVDTVVCSWECPDGYERVPACCSGLVAPCCFPPPEEYDITDTMPPAAVAIYSAHSVCDTIWLPKKQVWLTGEWEQLLVALFNRLAVKGDTLIWYGPMRIIDSAGGRTALYIKSGVGFEGWFGGQYHDPITSGDAINVVGTHASP